jgi:cobyrinic acid a,c-diamide synthase
MNAPVTIGVVRDSAFQFYYPENLEALQERGAILKEISSFDERPLPRVDALYIGGGFPETHLDVLAGNRAFRESLKQEIEAGLPVYAECGGLMFLCRGIQHQLKTFPMIGIFPFDVVLESKPQGHGYTILECVNENPFFAGGATFKGHEFHYSRLIVGHNQSFPFIFKLRKGHGIVAGWDGMCYKSALASYSHIHSVGNDNWAEAMISAAQSFRLERSDRSSDNWIAKSIRNEGSREPANIQP